MIPRLTVGQQDFLAILVLLTLWWGIASWRQTMYLYRERMWIGLAFTATLWWLMVEMVFHAEMEAWLASML